MPEVKGGEIAVEVNSPSATESIDSFTGAKNLTPFVTWLNDCKSGRADLQHGLGFLQTIKL